VSALDEAGGLSNLSEIRTVTYDCSIPDSKGDGSGKSGGPAGAAGENAGKANEYNVTHRIIGPEQVMCCDNVEFKIQLSWDCKDAFGRELITLTGVTWSLVQHPTDSGSTITAQDNGKATVAVSCEESQVVTLKAEIEFVDLARGGSFTTVATHKFFVDCDRGKPEHKPWLLRKLMYYGDGLQHYIHPDYHGVSVAPAIPLTTPESILLTLNVLYPPQAAGGSGQVYGGEPIGYFYLDHVVAMGPTVRTDYELFPEKIQDGLEDTFPCRTADYTGKPTGEILESQIHLSLGCGISFYDDSVTLYTDHLIGNEGYRRGLKKWTTDDENAYEATCTIEVDYACGLDIYEQQLRIYRPDLIHPDLGLRVPKPSDTDCCQIGVYIGCGLKFGDQGKFRDDCNEGVDVFSRPIQVDIAAIAGDGLRANQTQDATNCKLELDLGCGLDIDPQGALRIDTAEWAGPGLIPYGECGLQVNPGCGIYIHNDAVTVDTYALAGDGLTTNDSDLSGCELQALLACGLKFDDQYAIAVDPNQLAGCGLTVGDSCQNEYYSALSCYLNIDYGCGLAINQQGQLEVDQVMTGNVGYWWGMDPGSLTIASDGNSITICLQRTAHTLEKNDCDVVFGDLLSGQTVRECVSFDLPYWNYHVWEGYDCNLNCIEMRYLYPSPGTDPNNPYTYAPTPYLDAPPVGPGPLDP